MKSVEADCRGCTLDSFFCADVSDLMASSVAGGALTAVTAVAYAFGSSTLAVTNTQSITRQFRTGGSISLGWGTAVAGGNNPQTNVSVFGAGDVVLGYTTTTSSSIGRNSFHNYLAVSTGFVLAIDF